MRVEIKRCHISMYLHKDITNKRGRWTYSYCACHKDLTNEQNNWKYVYVTDRHDKKPVSITLVVFSSSIYINETSNINK